MSRFVTQETQRLDLGGGDWVEIPKALSYAEVSKYTSIGSHYEIGKAMLLGCIKAWNLKISDDSEEIAPITEENILKLDVKTTQIIDKALIALMENNETEEDRKKK